MAPTEFTRISYGLALASHAALAVALATIWRSRAYGSGLRVAVTATAVWAGVLAFGPTGTLDAGTTAIESLKSVAWIWFVSRAVAPAGSAAARATLYFAPFVTAIATIVAVAAPHAGLSRALDAGVAARIAAIGALLLAIFGVVVTEQAARNTKASRAWAVKFLWLGVGALFAFDVVLYSTAYLSQAIPPALWAARGLVVASLAPLIGVGVVRAEQLERRFVMSQRLVFYTASAVLAAVYVSVVVLLAEIVHARGGAWGGVLGILLGFAGLLVLAVLLMSGSIRARVGVLLAKHLLAHRYDYRSEWLELTESLTREADGSSLPVRIVDAFKRLTHASDGGVWVREDERLVPRAGGWFNAAPPVEPCGNAFCRFLEDHDWIVNLDLARSRTGRDRDVPVPQWLADARDAWLAIPLRHKHRLVALVVLSRPLAAGVLTWEDLDLLRTAARQAASYVALEQAGEALSRERQFAAMHRVTAFLMHDLSNVVAQQRLLVDNAEVHKSNPQFIEDAITTINDTAQRMSRLLEQVKSGVAMASPERVCVADTCRKVAARLGARAPHPILDVADEAATALVAAEPFGRIVEHLVRNAQDASSPSGTVTVRVHSDGPTVCVAIVDTGEGMDEKFVRERLFRPFDTTKGAAGMGLGAFEAREFVRAAGGELEVTSAPGLGTSLVLRLPRLEADG